MKLAILETGAPPGDLAERFGDYPAMFRDLLGNGFETDSFDVAAGEYPAKVDDYDAYLITGSPAGVYDKLPWIAPLTTFLKRAKGRAKLVGICFGHQIMAEAFGGHVEKSVQGLGRRAADLSDRPARGLDGRGVAGLGPGLAPGPGRASAAEHARSSPRLCSRLMRHSPGATSRPSPSSSIPNSRPITPRR